MLTVSTFGRLFNWVSVLILLMFAGTWAAMIALTHYPASETLWFINITANRLFGDAIHMVHAMTPLGVVGAGLLFAGLALVTALATRRGAAVRFLAAHVSVALVSVPLMRSVVAANSDMSAFLIGGGGRAWLDLAGLDALRLQLIAAALIACLATHMELVRRVGRDAAVRRRARQMMALG